VSKRKRQKEKTMKSRFGRLAVCAALAALVWAAPGRADEEKKKADDYPLDTCVVSGEKLGDMGDTVVFQYEGHEVRFCCKKCKKDFLKDPEKYLKMIDDAAKAKAEGKTPEKPKGEEGHGEGHPK
jgi:YHS domain-containing protein